MRLEARAAAAMGGSGAPRLSFCCELPGDDLGALLADGSVLADLGALSASVSLALIHLDVDTAACVRRFNDAGVPVTAWLVLDERDGYYSTPDNAVATAARYDAFKAWAAEHQIAFASVALDIEPPIQELKAIAGPERRRVLRRWAARLFDRRRLADALAAYRELLARVRADGYSTETYQFGFVVDEREAGSTVLQRAIGSMDLRADREWLMLYSSLLGDVAAGFLWNYARSRYLPAIGDTGGTGPIPALSWQQFARDLRLARRWGSDVTVYSLEGSVRQGYLRRMRDFEWNPPVARPAVARPMRLGQAVFRVMLISAEHPRLALLSAAILLPLARRPRLALDWLLAALAYHRLVRPRLRTWGATAGEGAAALPGDRIVPRPRLQHTRAVTIRATAAEVWPWLVQMGFRRGGYYYPGWLDALWGFAIRRRYRHEPWYTDECVVNVNAEHVVPEWQNIRVGDRVADGPDGYFEVREVLPERALVLYTARHPASGRPLDPADPRVGVFVECSWAFVLDPIDPRTTRLLVRTRGDHSPGLLGRSLMLVLFEPVDWLMQTVMLSGIRRRVEQATRQET